MLNPCRVPRRQWMQLLNPMRLPTSLTSRQRSSLLAVTILVLAYVALLAPLVGRYEATAFRLCLVPIVVASFLFGYRGLLVAVFINGFNLWFIRYSGRAPASLAPDFAISGAVTSFLTAFAVSALGEMTRKIKGLNRELKELSLIDPLTRLHNRRFASEVVATMAATFLIKKTEEEVKKRNTNLESKVMGIFVLDIDHFKHVNDNFGHGAGDKVLVAREGNAARQILKNPDAPFHSIILSVVDDVDLTSKKSWWCSLTRTSPISPSSRVRFARRWKGTASFWRPIAPSA